MKNVFIQLPLLHNQGIQKEKNLSRSYTKPKKKKSNKPLGIGITTQQHNPSYKLATASASALLEGLFVPYFKFPEFLGEKSILSLKHVG